MRLSPQWYQASFNFTLHDFIKSPKMFKDKVKWQDFSETLITAMQQTKGQSDFLLS
jgi:hypothetical protein